MVGHWEFAGRRVYVAGHDGMVGTALCRQLRAQGCNILVATRAEVELRDRVSVNAFLRDANPDAVVICAARVGGIEANRTQPASFLYDNLAIEMNLINGAHEAGVPRLLFLGSSCMYPRLAEQPIREEALLEGPLEPTNEWYAIAKIAGLKLCQAYRRQYGRDYICAVPTNLYGPGDNFSREGGHVVPAMIRKVHDAKQAGGAVEVWGTGAPEREFMYVEDCAEALVLLLARYSDERPINVSGGETVSIRELATTVAACVGYDGAFRFDHSKPDGMPRKSLDAARVTALGFAPRWSLSDGLAATYDWFLAGPAHAGPV